MTTDPKDAGIARYDLDLMESRMVKDQWGGEWVRHSDHATEIARLTAERDQARAEAAKWHADANLMLGFADLAYEVGAMPTSSELIAASDRALAAHANAARAEAIKRAEKAEAALSESHAREAALHHAITEASEPDFIWGAMDNVNDMDADLEEFAEATSRAIRAAVPAPADAQAALSALEGK